MVGTAAVEILIGPEDRGTVGLNVASVGVSVGCTCSGGVERCTCGFTVGDTRIVGVGCEIFQIK